MITDKRKEQLLNNLGNGMKGKIHSEKTKRKMRKAKLKRKEILGYINSPETRRKMSISFKGRKVSKKTRKKMSIARKGIKLSSETKLKMSLARRKEKSCNWKGGRRKQSGYIMIYNKNYPHKSKRKYIFEHRIIWEQYHNKKLSKNMVIHHLNGIKDDNRPKNLVAMKNGEHVHQTEPYKKRIRELEAIIAKISN